VSLKKVFVLTLGCPKNEVDSLIMKRHLELCGFSVVDEPDDADVVVVNTCGFIEDAKRESIDAVISAVDSGKEVVVAGCLYQRYGDELAELFPEVKGFVSLSHIRELPRYLGMDGFRLPCGVPALPRASDFEGVNLNSLWVYVKIAEGCSNRCGYCAIPLIRGSYRSRSLDDVVEEVSSWIEKGVKEINLISQDTAFYGRDLSNGSGLLELLERIEALEGDFRVRMLYMHPAHFTSDIARFIANSDKCIPYVEIPLQHVSERVLRLMKRKGAKEAVMRAVSLCEEYGLFLRTTFLVGHPGEGEDDFSELVDFVEALRPWRACVFGYSAEEGTASFELEQLDKEVVLDRVNVLTEILDRIMFERSAELAGKSCEALLEGETGRLLVQAPEVDGVFTLKGESFEGLCRVIVDEAKGVDFEGRLCRSS